MQCDDDDTVANAVFPSSFADASSGKSFKYSTVSLLFHKESEEHLSSSKAKTFGFLLPTRTFSLLIESNDTFVKWNSFRLPAKKRKPTVLYAIREIIHYACTQRMVLK